MFSSEAAFLDSLAVKPETVSFAPFIFTLTLPVRVSSVTFFLPKKAVRAALDFLPFTVRVKLSLVSFTDFLPRTKRVTPL